MVVKAAGFVVFRRLSDTIQYLLLQASYANFHWSPPKGHIERNENEFDSALRETLEETGLCESDIKIFKDCTKTLSYEANGKPKIVIYWLAEMIAKDKGIILSEEHQAYKWLELRDALALAEYQSTKELLEYCDNFIHKEILNN
ncbi:bis(5'-nucleosyl)-tetraphosphatase [asymmetrical]-like [Ctenocephalides felis]|uniref:bis(5'-nucleosyl)-tetraphosphatase [asymmetrical]-like n=1 Tax=Ctenocephalides felis TaxID=7515 RepID=UPI000E6E2D65|nr:bis(5'-nucleosyl)-tetraphosphatase [asymmetrical]-like [Ctenocephalides felis]